MSFGIPVHGGSIVLWVVNSFHPVLVETLSSFFILARVCRVYEYVVMHFVKEVGFNVLLNEGHYTTHSEFPLEGKLESDLSEINRQQKYSLHNIYQMTWKTQLQTLQIKILHEMTNDTNFQIKSSLFFIFSFIWVESEKTHTKSWGHYADNTLIWWGNSVNHRVTHMKECMSKWGGWDSMWRKTSEIKGYILQPGQYVLWWEKTLQSLQMPHNMQLILSWKHEQLWSLSVQLIIPVGALLYGTEMILTLALWAATTIPACVI